MMKKWIRFAAAGLVMACLTSCQSSPAPSDSAQTTEAAGQAEGTEKAESQEKAEGQEKAEEGSTAEDASGNVSEEEYRPSGEPGVTQIPNPMEEIQGAEDLAEIGVSMDAPEGAEDVQYFVISGVVAEISFTLDNNLYTYRGSATAEDFAGIFEEMEEEIITVPGTEELGIEGDLLIKTTKSGGRLASWKKNGANYTLYTPATAEEEALTELCQELIANN